MIGSFVLGLISVDAACLYPNTFLPNSMTATCNPRQIPKKGILVSLAYLAAVIFPSIPLSPKPGAINIPSWPPSNSSTFSFSISSEDTQLTFTLHSFLAPPCIKDSAIDLYASWSSTYLPTRAIFTSFVGFFNLVKNSFQFSRPGSSPIGSWNISITRSSSFSFLISNGTS